MLAMLLNATLATLIALLGLRTVAFLAFRAYVALQTFKARTVDHEGLGETQTALNIFECEDWYLGSWGLLTRDCGQLWHLIEEHKNDGPLEPIFYARSFAAALKYLPLCPGLEDKFSLYFVVNGDYELYHTSDDAAAAWERRNKPYESIFITHDVDLALDHIEKHKLFDRIGKPPVFTYSYTWVPTLL